MEKVTIDDLIEIIGEIIDISKLQIDYRTVFGEDIPVDSKDMLRLISRIESRYRFRFEASEIIALKTVEDVLKIIQSHLKAER